LGLFVSLGMLGSLGRSELFWRIWVVLLVRFIGLVRPDDPERPDDPKGPDDLHGTVNLDGPMDLNDPDGPVDTYELDNAEQLEDQT